MKNETRILIAMITAVIVMVVIYQMALDFECSGRVENLHKSCVEAFVEIAGMNTTAIFQTYEFCALLTNSTELKEIVDACQLLNATNNQGD